MRWFTILAGLAVCWDVYAQAVVKIDTALPDTVIDTALADTKLDTLWHGRVFHAPLTDTYLQSSTLASELVQGNHATSTAGSVVYSSTGAEFDGSSSVSFTISGVVSKAELTYMMRFIPDSAHTSNTNERIFSTTAANTYVQKRNTAGGNALRIVAGNNTNIAEIAAATYGPSWNVGVENTLIVTLNDTTNRTNAWLNGTQILVEDTTAFAVVDDNDMIMGVGGSVGYNGKILDFLVYGRIVTAAEMAVFDNGGLI